MKKTLLSLLLVGASFGLIAKEAFFKPEAFIKELKNSKGTVLVKVTASWCGPCQAMKPAMENVKKTFKRTVTFKDFPVEELMSGQDAGALALKKAFDLDIPCIPMFLIFKNGEFVKALVGSRNEEQLTAVLHKVLVTSAKELLKEDRLDIPEALKQQLNPPKLEGIQLEQAIKTRNDIQRFLDFVKDPVKNKELQEAILNSDMFKGFDMVIAQIDKRIAEANA